MSRRRALASTILVTAAALAIAVGGWWVLHRDPADRPMPTDDEVRALWRAHRADFEVLRAMLDADRGHLVVGEDRVDQCWYFERDDEWSCQGTHARDVAAMLKVAGLPADRYALHLQHLSASAGGGRNGGMTASTCCCSPPESSAPV